MNGKTQAVSFCGPSSFVILLHSKASPEVMTKISSTAEAAMPDLKNMIGERKTMSRSEVDSVSGFTMDESE